MKALEGAKFKEIEEIKEYTMEDLFFYSLVGAPDSKELRQKIGEILRIGYGNGKQFLNKLNHYSINKTLLENTLDELSRK